MPLTRRPIQIREAAEMLGISPDSIRKREAGTNALTLFKRKGCNRLYVWDTEVERLLKESIIIIAKGKYSDED